MRGPENTTDAPGEAVVHLIPWNNGGRSEGPDRANESGPSRHHASLDYTEERSG